MAQKLVTTLTDDITGKPIPDGEGETLEFAFGGYVYEIDLDIKNAEKLRAALSPYITNGRRIGKLGIAPLRRSGADSRRSSSDVDPAAVRAWAEENGYEVSPRGRIRAEVVEAYRAAQG